jgi:hypothetical protein
VYNTGDRIITIRHINSVMLLNNSIEVGTIGTIVKLNFGIYNWIVRTDNKIEFECRDMEIKLFKSTKIESNGFGYLYDLERNITI